MENQCATSFHPKRGLIWILIINTIPIQLGINVPIKTVNVGEICSPARWHQHSFGQRPIQRSPAPCGPRAGGLVWGFFQFSTSEVVSHGLKAGSMYVKPDDFGIFSFLNPRRLRLQVLYNAASAHTPQHLDRKDFDTCWTNPSFAKQQRSSKSPMDREENHLVSAIYSKKIVISSYTDGSLTLSHLITSAIYSEDIIL